jgi:hypothetical protein
LVLRLRDLEERDPVDRHDGRAVLSDKRTKNADRLWEIGEEAVKQEVGKT